MKQHNNPQASIWNQFLCSSIIDDHDELEQQVSTLKDSHRFCSQSLNQARSEIRQLHQQNEEMTTLHSQRTHRFSIFMGCLIVLSVVVFFIQRNHVQHLKRIINRSHDSTPRYSRNQSILEHDQEMNYGNNENQTNNNRDNRDNKDNQCSICYESFERPYALIPCGHVFCEKCIEWVMMMSPLSPGCRTRVSNNQRVFFT
eukprot:gb/GECH01014477.1/.p1 GENE.gb/GECH01014477.1/~~gb/GECH01014477.1/.p1  ORF type:complete len:200 (+),score=46.82 gb/GECH01014477.1/:1-600(+)